MCKSLNLLGVGRLGTWAFGPQQSGSESDARVFFAAVSFSCVMTGAKNDEIWDVQQVRGTTLAMARNILYIQGQKHDMSPFRA